MEELKHIELIEAYHEGKLSPEANVEFEVRLLVDQELQEENELYKKILYGFHDIKTDQIRMKLRQIDIELDHRKKGGSGRGKFFWFTGIAASLLIAFFLYVKFSEAPKFTASLIPFETGLPVLMGTEGKLEFDNAMSELKAGNYQAAEKGFSNCLVSNSANDTTMYFLG